MYTKNIYICINTGVNVMSCPSVFFFFLILLSHVRIMSFMSFLCTPVLQRLKYVQEVYTTFSSSIKEIYNVD